MISKFRNHTENGKGLPIQPLNLSVVGGIIRLMKRILILVVVIVMSASSLQPANAIFGLSKCEKVKKEIQALEKSFNSKQSSWTKYQNVN